MQHRIYIPVILLLLLLSSGARAQKQYFTDISEKQIPEKGKRIIVPSVYRITSSNAFELRDFLWSLPEQKSITDPSLAPIISLPAPDGTIQRFRIWNAPIQEIPLQQKFSEIQTFCGQGIDDPYATLRADFNPYFGFHAQVLSIKGDYYIDPYSRNNTDHYISYYKKNNIRTTDFVCGFNEERLAARAGLTPLKPCRGAQLKTYRLAVACTGQYAVAVGGTTPAALHAAIVTTVNRVNGVYENELNVRLVLVANNPVIEFMDAATDPFSGNSNASTLIFESQDVITQYIGTANFDIGHTFSTGSGGLAYLGVICGAGTKALGVTGQSNPTGDSYDIDYVAHEIGHQFGAYHSFNGTGNSCGNNRTEGSAYEVGSGTTIMGYAGICGTDNIQPHSDAVFHATSYDEISYIINGSACGTLSNTGNTLPVITSMLNNNANIPLSTPFTLTGTATDANGDALSYCWEEWDLGPATKWNGGNANTTSPLFKSRIPKNTGSRSFPDMAVILANYPSRPSATTGGLKGETLPTQARSMSFRLTVRDNRSGGGAIVSGGTGCQADLTSAFRVNTIAGTGPFAVTYPNGGETIAGGQAATITWNTAGTNIPPISTMYVRIFLSLDGGYTYPLLLKDSVVNDGSESINTPAINSSTARIKIAAVGNIYFDISNANFKIIQSLVCNPTGIGCSDPDSSICSGQSVTLTVQGTLSAGAAWRWYKGGCGSGSSIGSSNTITVNPTTTTTYYVRAISGECGTTACASITVIVRSIPIAPSPIQGTSTGLCNAQNVSFSCPALSNADSYTWYLPQGGVIASGQGSSSIMASFGNSLSSTSFTSASRITVKATNSCGTGAAAYLSISLKPQVTGVISGPSILDAGTTGIYTVTPAFGATTYRWTVPSGWSIVSGQGTTTAEIRAGASGGTIRVLAGNSCGNGTNISKAVAVVAPAIVRVQ